MNEIIVCGGDKRNYFLCRMLKENGFNIKWAYAKMYPQKEDFILKTAPDLNNAYALILPLPLTKDGENLNTPYSEERIPLSKIKKLCDNHIVFTSDEKIPGINYFKNEAVTIDNARLTALGFLKELLTFENEDIMGKNALITGYGKVSQAVCDILIRNGVKVTVAARNENQRHLALTRGSGAITVLLAAENLYAYDYVINTVPQKLFTTEQIKKAEKNTAFFELASGLIDKSEWVPPAYIECKGMPGKHTPKAAGKVIAGFVSRELRGVIP